MVTKPRNEITDEIDLQTLKVVANFLMLGCPTSVVSEVLRIYGLNKCDVSQLDESYRKNLASLCIENSVQLSGI